MGGELGGCWVDGEAVATQSDKEGLCSQSDAGKSGIPLFLIRAWSGILVWKIHTVDVKNSALVLGTEIYILKYI